MPAVVAGGIAAITGLSATATGVVVASNLLLYAGTTAASLFLQQAMAPETKQEFGTKLKTVLGGAVNQSIIFGSKESAGSFVYKGTWGRGASSVPNAFLVKVYALSDYPVDGFSDTMWAGGRKCTINSGVSTTIDGNNIGHPVPAFNVGGDYRLWVKFHDGSQTVADPYLRDKFGSGSRAWTSDMIGRGRAYVIVTQKYDKKEPAGEVDPVFVARGGKWYDWREGDHVYGTYSTYDYSANPVVLIYNIMRGIYYGDEWMYGGQKWPATRFDAASFTAAANVCDEDVSLAGGGTQKRYRVGGEIDLSEDPWTVIERLLKACNGRIVESGGVFKVYAGGIGASVFSFTDDDVLVSEELTAKFFPARDAIANTIVGSYVEPNNAGEAKAYKSRTDAAFIASDGGEVRKQSFDLDYVRENRQAQQLAKLALNDNRRFRSFSVAFWTIARKLEPCDVVSWTSTRFGFTNKKFICGEPALRDDGVVVINLREADAADADWSTGDEAAYDVGVFEAIATPSQTLTATVTAVAITDDDNVTARRPAVRIQATLDDDFVDCEALLVQVRKKLGDQKMLADIRRLSFFEDGNPQYGDLIFTDNSFLPGKQVQVRHKVDPESDRETAWSSWVDLTLTNARLKIQTPTDDNDIDLVVTDNVAPNTIWNKASFTYSKAEVTISGGGGDTVSDSNIGDIVISNPNKTPVFINFEYQITAKTTNGTAVMDLTLYGGGEVLRTVTATAKNNSGDSTMRTDTTAGTVVVMDAAWSPSDGNNRTYKVGMVLERIGANAGGRVYLSKITLTWGLR